MANHVVSDAVKNRHREQREADHEQTGHRAAIERNSQCRGPRFGRGLSRAHVRQHSDPHPDETRRQRTECADHKTDRSWVIFKEKKQKENDDCDRADRNYLAIQISLGAFLHGRGDLAHPLVAR